MTLAPDAIRFPRLRAATGSEHFALHQAALEWSLDAPILIENERDIESRPHWQDHLDPYAHQIQNLITFCRRAPVALIADDVGLGKTISAGLILSELMTRRKVHRALVLCPKLLLPQWKEELDQKFGIEAAEASGREFQLTLRSDIPVAITTYHTARSMFDEIRKRGFDMLILDEAHKLRNLYGTQKPPGVATAVHKAMADRVFKYVLLLTATPIQNRLWDLYSLLDLLSTAKGHKHPLGDPAFFVTRYVADGATKATQINRGRRDEFRRHLSNYIVRTRRGDSALEFPERHVRMVRTPARPAEVRLMALASRLFKDNRLNALSQTSVAQSLMSSPEAFVEQLNNMVQRDNTIRRFASEAEEVLGEGSMTGKLNQLTTLVAELTKERPRDWRLVVFTIRKATQNAIGEHLQEHGIPVGFIRGGAAKENQNAIAAFKEDPPGVRVIVSTDAGAEGVNLQVANVVVNYDLPWNPMIVEQRIGRVQRLATKHASVHVLNFVVAGSVEERVVGRLSEKLQGISQSLGDIESILESAGSDMEMEDGFEALIRKMVVESLCGQDVEKALHRAAASIERGKQIFESEKENVEKHLGRLDAMHRSGPRLPTLTPLKPSIKSEEFVVRALMAEGAMVERDDLNGDLLTVRRPGRPDESITFDELVAREAEREMRHEFNPVFSGNIPRLYQPGRPSFERLAQSWSERSAALVHDLGAGDDASWCELINAWLKQVEGARVVSARLVEENPRFQGEATIRAAAAVSHDRFERLITVSVRPDEHRSIDEAVIGKGTVCRDEVDVPGVLKSSREAVLEQVAGDTELRGFCEFYAARLQEELETTGATGRAAKDLQQRLGASITGELVSVRGARYSQATIEAMISMDDAEPIADRFELVAATGQLLSVPAIVRCEHTGRSAPAACTERCDCSGLRVLRHLLIKSENSNRLALPQFQRMCEVSGKALLSDEVVTLDGDGRVVDARLVQTSGISDRRALSTEMVVCEFSGVRVCPDEVLTSAVSGRRGRADQMVESVVSGRRAHESESVVSEDPPGPILSDEVGVSAVSGRRCHKDRLVASEADPSRMGLADEVVVCEQSQRRLLVDEVARSAVSGRTIGRDLMVASASSGKLAAADETVTCEASGDRLLPDEASRCSVTGKLVNSKLLVTSDASGRKALEDAMVVCEFSGVRVCPDEVLTSAVSGRRGRADQMVESVVSGRRAHESESVVSEDPPGPILSDEVGVSAVSGRRCHKDRLVASEADPSRMGLADEVVVCEQSQRRLLVDEVARSAVSGRTIGRDLMVASASSGKLAAADETVTCEASGDRLLPDEASRCSVTGKLVNSKLLVTSDASGRKALEDAMVVCEFSGVRVCPDEVLTSAVSGRRGRADQMVESVVSGRRAHESESVVSEDPPGPILSDEVGVSAVSGRRCHKDRLVASEADPSRMGLADEVVVCEQSQRRLLVDEVARSAVSGRTIGRDLMVASASSGKLAAADEMVTCDVSGERLLPDEAARCAITGKLVNVHRLLGSDLSGRLALREHVVRSEVTGRRLLSDEVIQSDASGAYCESGDIVVSEKSGRKGLPNEAVVCAETHRRLLIDEVGRCEVSGATVEASLLVSSERSGRRVLERLSAVCEVSGRRLCLDEAELSAVSGKRVDRAIMVASDATGKVALPDEMVVCQSTGRRLLPTEVTTCSVSQKQVDSRLLTHSQLSDRVALPQFSRKCDISGRQAIQDELECCALTGKWVCPEYLGTCCITSRRMLKERMTMVWRTDRGYYWDGIAEQALRSAGHAEPLMRSCCWSGVRLPANEVARCELSGLTVSNALLNDAGELAIFRRLLDGATIDQALSRLNSAALRWLQEQVQSTGKLGDHAALRAPDKRHVFLVAQVVSGLLGLRSRVVGLVIRVDEQPRLACPLLVGIRRNGAWQPGA